MVSDVVTFRRPRHDDEIVLCGGDSMKCGLAETKPPRFFLQAGGVGTTNQWKFFLRPNDLYSSEPATTVATGDVVQVVMCGEVMEMFTPWEG